jgi:kynurenine formamidase
VDLSRATHHKMQGPVNHPTIEVYPFGTHVDAFAHFDDRPGATTIEQVPLERFFTEALYLDLTHVPDRTGITVAHLEAALRIEGLAAAAQRDGDPAGRLAVQVRAAPQGLRVLRPSR